MPFDKSLLNEIKERLDLREIVEKELGQGKPSGESIRWPCPFHQGHNPTTFMVTKHQYRCWSCEASGDVFAWLMERGNLEFKAAFKQAAREAGVSLKDPLPPGLYPSPPRRPIRPVRPLLYQRGLKDETIQNAHLGYDPGRKIIVIPWYINGELWRVGTKSLAEGEKAPLFAGFKQGLYNADRLTPGQPVLLLEGEFDALIVEQEAGDLVVPLATGGVTVGRQVRWVARLVNAPTVWVAFDADRAGNNAAQWWLSVLPHNSKRYRPLGAKDPNDI